MTLPICPVTGDDVDDCRCVDADAATFICDHCGAERPLAEREVVAFEVWCTRCVDRFDLPEED